MKAVKFYNKSWVKGRISPYLCFFIFLLVFLNSASAGNNYYAGDTVKKDTTKNIFPIDDPRNPDCPCHKLQEQANNEFKKMKEEEGKNEKINENQIPINDKERVKEVKDTLVKKEIKVEIMQAENKTDSAINAKLVVEEKVIPLASPAINKSYTPLGFTVKAKKKKNHWFFKMKRKLQCTFTLHKKRKVNHCTCFFTEGRK